MKKLSIIFICTMFVFANNFAQGVKTELEKSQKSGKSVFMVVTDKASKGTDYLVQLSEAAKKKSKNTTVIKLDRDDKANAELVTKYRIAGVPLPLILVLSSNGVATGSLNSTDATNDKLLAMLPTKTQAEVLLGFENGKPALIVCGKKNAKDKSAIEAECKTASTTLGGKTTQVFIDVDSKDEANFIALLKPDNTKTTVLVFNGKGQYTGTLEATAKSADLVASVNKRIGGGCCSGGNSGGCGSKKSGCGTK